MESMYANEQTVQRRRESNKVKSSEKKKKKLNAHLRVKTDQKRINILQPL